MSKKTPENADQSYQKLGERRMGIYFWLHTSFSAVSIAFFLSLLSANTATIDTWSIKFASVLFCISVILNSGLSMFLACFGENDIYFHAIYPTHYPWYEPKSLPGIAIYIFILGIIFLFGYYSWFYRCNCDPIYGSLHSVQSGSIKIIEGSKRKEYK